MSVKFCIIFLLDILSLDLKIPLSPSNLTFHYDPATCLCQDTRYNRYYFSITEKNLKIWNWNMVTRKFLLYRVQNPDPCAVYRCGQFNSSNRINFSIQINISTSHNYDLSREEKKLSTFQITSLSFSVILVKKRRINFKMYYHSDSNTDNVNK